MASQKVLFGFLGPIYVPKIFPRITDVGLNTHLHGSSQVYSSFFGGKQDDGLAKAIENVLKKISDCKLATINAMAFAAHSLIIPLGIFYREVGIKEAIKLIRLEEDLQSCKKSSKTAEKCSALLESLVTFDEGRTALAAEEGGVLTLVEVLEEGSPQSREYAVGALLKMCESDRCRYREVILGEGVIPGLLELTVQGTPKSQSKARALLQLLRNSPHSRSELQGNTLENIVSNIASQIDGEDCAGKAKKMVAEMVQVSREQSWRHLQQRAFVRSPTELSLGNCPSEVSSK